MNIPFFSWLSENESIRVYKTRKPIRMQKGKEVKTEAYISACCYCDFYFGFSVSNDLDS